MTMAKTSRSRWSPRMVLLSTAGHDELPEIWCRCDGGPHRARRSTTTFSVEVRYGGVHILADPGTYCYCGPQAWRSYLRAVIPYRIVEAVGWNQAFNVGWNQPFDKGRFLRFRKAHAWDTGLIDQGDVASWAAEHDGYLWIDSPMRHRRSVLLDRASRIVDIIDQIAGGCRDFRSVFYFGPEIQVELGEFCAFLSWPGSVTPGAARLELPLGLSWGLHQRAETDDAPGESGKREPGFTLLGRGPCVAGVPLATRLEFSDTEMLPDISVFQAISWSASVNRGDESEDEDQAEAK
jgi:hypothetical protein